MYTTVPNINNTIYEILGVLDGATHMNTNVSTYVKVIPEAGMATIYTPNRGRSGDIRRVSRTAADHRQLSKSRDQKNLEAYGRSHHCDSLVTLTYGSVPNSPNEVRQDWKKVLRQSQPAGRCIPYAMVAEASKDTRVHLHVMTKVALAETLSCNWSHHGHVDIQSIPFTDLGAVAEYMAKDFAKPNRLFTRRFTALRGSKPLVERYEVSDFDEGFEIVANFGACATVERSDEMKLPFGQFTKIIWTPCQNYALLEHI